MSGTLTAVLLAGILGLVGQGARAIIGLKQLADSASNPKTLESETFSAARLVISLVIGFIAGVLSAMALGLLDPAQAAKGFDNKTMLGLIAAGYAGTDVIEGFMAKYVPQTDSTKTPDPLPPLVPALDPARTPEPVKTLMDARVLQLLPAMPTLQASLVGFQAPTIGKSSQDQQVRAACEAEWDTNKSDCSAFVRAVASRISASVSGSADEITSTLNAGGPWTKLADGPAAASAAHQGFFVVAGLQGADEAVPNQHGHVVVVVDGPLNRGKYPRAYWGRLGGIGARDQTINWAWKESDRDKVTYAAYDP